MTRTCPPCDRPVRDGYLCFACTRTLADTIRATPEWADQLTLVLARLTRYAEPVGGRGETPVFFNPAASDQARRLDKALRSTARMVGAVPEVTTARLGVVAAWLVAHIDAVRRHPDAGLMEAMVSRAVEQTMALCDRPPELWYAGPCPECGKDLYPSTAEQVVTCPCGRAWSVDDKRAELLARARDAVRPGPEIARALSALGDRPVSPDLLRKWRHKGVLRVRRMTLHPATNWYRVGDVLDLVVNEGRKRRR